MNALTKTLIRKAMLPLGLFITSMTIFSSVNGQSSYQGSMIKTVIEGTSNIHDWKMESQKGKVTATVTLDGTNVKEVGTISFVLPAESLKSEHNQMDKNTYKALNTTKNPNISFSSNSSSIKPNGNGFILTSKGKLTISGVSKDVELVAHGKINADKSISFTGAHTLKMTDYKVQPPTAVFGTIKTGDGITVKYNLVLKAS